jgi:transposase
MLQGVNVGQQPRLHLLIARNLGPGVRAGAERGDEQRRLPHVAGVPLLVVPDNTRTGVSKACRYDPDVNPTYQNFAAHYGFGVLPARPYKPRDKAVVENAVQVAQRWILAALRHRKFFSLAEANQSVGELLHRLNHRPFRKRDGRR